MRLLLAPMEGVIDGFVRQLLTELNPYQLCITEFVRVTETLLPKQTFFRRCPELHHQGITASKTPVRIQLLGQSPHWMAENACRAIELGSHGIDINAGCPAKTVVGHQAGASLLKNPELLYHIVSSVRQAVDKTQPVSVKIRLGWDSAEHCLEIADAISLAGANEMTVHGRTKHDHYQADKINWKAIAQMKQHLTIPVIANGEIVDPNSAETCQALTHCDGLMIGRGALRLPNLGAMIINKAPLLPWSHVLLMLKRYSLMQNTFIHTHYHCARIKQWLGFLRHNYPEALTLFQKIRTLNNIKQIRLLL